MFNQPPNDYPAQQPPAGYPAQPPYGQSAYPAPPAYQVPAAAPLPPIGRYRALAVISLILRQVLPFAGFLWAAPARRPRRWWR